MTHDEKGYIQFECEWEVAAAPDVPPPLIRARNRLFELGLIGVYPDGIGFGNVSERVAAPLRTEDRPPLRFIISGTATGSIPVLGPEHFTLVHEYAIARNWLMCKGPVKASSESLSHAALYECDPEIQAVLHVHHLGLWDRHRGRLPTTDPIAEAGTPAMADAIHRLLKDEFACKQGVFVMGGHREGLMAFGASVQEAADQLVRLLGQLPS